MLLHRTEAMKIRAQLAESILCCNIDDVWPANSSLYWPLRSGIKRCMHRRCQLPIENLPWRGFRDMGAKAIDWNLTLKFGTLRGNYITSGIAYTDWMTIEPMVKALFDSECMPLGMALFKSTRLNAPKCKGVDVFMGGTLALAII
jgi:hypothetical protein